MNNPLKLSKLANVAVKCWSFEREQLIKQAYQEIVSEANLQGATLQSWIKCRTKNIRYNDLVSFSRVCLKGLRCLEANWLDELFEAAGFRREDIPDELKQLNRQRQVRAGQPNRVPDDAQLLQTYTQAVLAWSQYTFTVSNKPIDLASAYIHRRLIRNEPAVLRPGGEASTRHITFAETLATGESIHAFITAPSGYGKSTLWRYLAGYFTNSGGTTIAVPIDGFNADNFMSFQEMLVAAIAQTGTRESAENIARLARRLDEQLRAGTAIALIDNWNHGPFSNAMSSWFSSIEQWRRVIVFSDHLGGGVEGPWESYALPELDWAEINSFIRSWSSATGHGIDSEALIMHLILNQEIARLATTPWYLGLICEFFARKKLFARKHDLIAGTVQWILRNAEKRTPRSGVKLRAALGSLALHLYEAIDEGRPVSKYLRGEAAYKHWMQQFPDEGAAMFDLANHCGMLSSSASGNHLYFLHPALQAFLAAEAWLQKPDWLEQTLRLRDSPPWADVLRFAATLLEATGNIDGLVRFLENLCAYQSHQDILEMNWLLAGECMAELNISTQERLEQHGIGQKIRRRLLSMSQHLHQWPQSMMVPILWRIKTNSFVNDLIELIEVELKEAPDLPIIEREDQTALRAITLLGDVGGVKAIDALRLVLERSADSSMRSEAISSLMRIRDNRAVEVLESLLDSADRRDALFALGHHNTLEAAHVLLTRRNHPDDSYIELGLFTNPEILPVLELEVKRWFSRQPNEPELPALVALLNSIAHIGGSKAVNILARFLQARNERLFDTAASLLGNMETAEACNVLLKFAEDTSHNARRRCSAISLLPDQSGLWSTSRLIQLLDEQAPSTTRHSTPRKRVEKSGPEMVSEQVSHKLFKSPDPALSFLLKTALEQARTPQARQRISMLLAEVRRPENVPNLYQLAESEDPVIRGAAISSLVLLKVGNWQERAVAELEYASLERQGVRRLYIALGAAKARGAVPTLAKVIHQYGIDSSDSLDAIWALGQIGGAQATDALINVWKQHVDKKNDTTALRGGEEILNAVAAAGNKEAVQFLLQLTGYSNQHFAQYALARIAKISNPDAIDTLVDALESPRSDIRQAAITTFGSMDSEAVLPSLARALDDENSSIRHIAESSILRRHRSIEKTETVNTILEVLVLAASNERAERERPQDSPDRVRRYSGIQWTLLQLLESVSQELVTDKLVDSVIEIANLEHYEPRLFERALCTLARFGNPKIVPSLSEQLSKYLWWYLAMPAFLCEMLKCIPASFPGLRRLAATFDFRILPDGIIVMASGEKLPCEQAAKLLQLRLFDRDL